jgi:hypothetical protein
VKRLEKNDPWMFSLLIMFEGLMLTFLSCWRYKVLFFVSLLVDTQFYVHHSDIK